MIKSNKANSFSTIDTCDGCYTNNTIDTMNHLINKFFPDNKMKIDNHPITHEATEPNFIKQEIANAIRYFNKKKSSGNDHTCVTILLKSANELTNLFLSFFNKCLDFGVFPYIYKVGVLYLNQFN